MVKVFGNRKWLLESKLEPKTKWFLVSPTVVRCQSFETKKGFESTIQVGFGGCNLTRSELKECLKILDFVEIEDKKLNGLLK